MAAATLRCFLVLILSTTALLASDIEGQVRSEVRPGLDNPGTIQLLHQRQLIDERTVTQDGRFEFHNVKQGDYVLRVHSPGYLDEEVPVAVVGAYSRHVVPITLRRMKDSFKDSGTTISVREYQIPGAAKREYERGLADRKRGDCAKAVPHLEKAIAGFHEYGEAFNELGNCFKQSDDFDRAEDSFKKAIEYGSTIYPAMNLADLYAGRERFAEARRVLEQSMAKYPTEGDLHFGMARIYFDQGQMVQAEAQALEAHSKIHRTADVHLLLSKIYLNLGRYPALLTQLETYLLENPTGPVADQVRKNLKDLR